jgi:translation initiation factor 5B
MDKGKGKKGGKAGGKPKGPSAIAKKAAAARQQAEDEDRLRKEEEDRLKQEQEAERIRLELEEKKRQEEKEIAKKKKKDEKERLKREGLWKTKAQIEKEERETRARELMVNSGMIKVENNEGPRGLPTNKKKKKKEAPPVEIDEKPPLTESIPDPVPTIPKQEEPVDSWDMEEPSSPSSKPELKKEEPEIKKEEPVKKKQKLQQIEADPVFKSPIVCVLGHVDTGKTKLLDKIRHTNVQTGEAGGITQQIGATMFPAEAISSLTQKLPNMKINLDVPGLLIIDTPGHESFSNLRSRGSSLCDLAILVVDIMHGLERQTLESLEMLRNKNIPFIVALNKIDRMYQWKSKSDEAFFTTFNDQQEHTRDEFVKRAKETVLAFAEKGLNAALYYENPDPEDYINLVPTSAITGEGIPDLLGMLVSISQTRLAHKIRYKPQLQATVMEVKVIEGLGTTIDVILANGRIKEDDKIVLAGFNGPIVTNIRALLTPMPLKEMRVKGEYLHHKSLHASMGVKISAQGLEESMSGSQLFVSNSEDDVLMLCDEVQRDIAQVFKSINKKGKGVHVQASTVGSLEALLEFLKQSEIPVCSVSIGPVYKKDIIKAEGQLQKLKRKEYATVLAFDVKITQEGQEYADKVGVKIFAADIIYHLFDRFTEYVKQIKDEERAAEGKGKDAIFPCILKTVQIIRANHPMILGVDVLGGVLKIGTPLCIPEKGNLRIGKVQSIELNKKPLNEARNVTGSVAVKIQPVGADQESVQAGKNFEESNQITSWITRDSIDALKEYFMDQMTMDDWKIVKLLKTTYGIV